MPIPTTIPSTVKRTPLVKCLDPVKFSMSCAQIDDVGAGGLDLITAGSIGQLAVRYMNTLAVAAKSIGLSTSQTSPQIIRDEIRRLLQDVSRGATPPSTQARIASAQIAIEEALRTKKILEDTVGSIALRDATGVKNKVRTQVKDRLLRESLFEVIDDISRKTRFG